MISGMKSLPMRVAASSAVGGTASVLTGGKFVNGAVTAAFAWLFNDEMHKWGGSDAPVSNPSDPNFHKYYVRTNICSVSQIGCTVQAVRDALYRYATPSSGGSTAIKSGDMSNVPFLGSVYHIINSITGTLVNVTQPGHRFYPGTVERGVGLDNGTIYVWSYGTGTGNYGWLNERASNPVWTTTDLRLKYFGRE
jgi:hypothetical protein